MIDIRLYPKDGYGYIYSYTSPSGKKYIGQTTASLLKRSGKRGQGYNGCTIFENAIKKYGWDNMIPNILGEFPIEELNDKESYYIKKYNTLIPNGYNKSLGGDSPGRKYQPVYAYNLDGTFYKEFFNKTDACKETGAKIYDITRCIQGDFKFISNYIWKDKYYEKVEPVYTTKNGGKQVAQIDIVTNKIIKIYPSMSAASRALGLSRPTHISECCHGQAKTCAGYKWQFLQSLTTTNL